MSYRQPWCPLLKIEAWTYVNKPAVNQHPTRSIGHIGFSEFVLSPNAEQLEIPIKSSSLTETRTTFYLNSQPNSQFSNHKFR